MNENHEENEEEQKTETIVSETLESTESRTSDISLQALDFNYGRQGTIPSEHRFSVNKVKQGIENIDPIQWNSKLDMPINNYFSYPSDLEAAQLHRQCCYLQPDEDFLKKAVVTQCPCCNQILRRERINLWTYDVYKFLGNDHGITLPLYFTFIKIHLIIMIIQFLTFGLFFMLESQQICREFPDLQCQDQNFDQCNACEFVHFYGFIDLVNFRAHIQRINWKSQTYQALAFFIFMLNMCVPFIHKVVMKYTQIKYWDVEATNHSNSHKKSVYVKHLPSKLSQEQIQKAIKKALENDVNLSKQSVLFTPEVNAIRELVYIYDIHEINLMNENRINLFLDLLMISQQLQELERDGVVKTMTILQIKNKKLKLTKESLKEVFKSKLQQLVYETSITKQYLKKGLPFTNKVILKFETTEQRNAVYIYYKKSFWESMRIRINVLRNSVQELKLRKKVEDYDIESDDGGVTSRTSSLMENALPLPIIPEPEDSIVPFHKQSGIGQTLLAKLQGNYEGEQIAQMSKDLRIYRGFRVNEIFWENLGMHTLTRFLLRLRSLLVTLVACSIMMALFELMYIYQNNPSYKKQKIQGSLSLEQKVLADIFTVMVSVVSSVSTLILLAQTVKSRRSTYTQQEKNIVSFMFFIQLILISFFPYIMSIELWNGTSSIIPIYDLVILAQNRILFKLAFHTFHIRHSRFWLSKKKILKNYNPYQYFQGQLNSLMTPPQFPQRGRLLAIFFIYTCGITMLFLCPTVLIICIACDIYLYFYDKRVALRNYTLDKRFNIKHMQFLVKTYQYIIIPVNMYLYLKLFWWSNLCSYVGTSIIVLFLIVQLFFGKKLVNFTVYRIFRPKRIRSSRMHVEKPYFQSYNDFFENLRIEELTGLLATIFKQVQDFRDSKQN